MVSWLYKKRQFRVSSSFSVSYLSLFIFLLRRCSPSPVIVPSSSTNNKPRIDHCRAVLNYKACTTWWSLVVPRGGAFIFIHSFPHRTLNTTSTPSESRRRRMDVGIGGWVVVGGVVGKQKVLFRDFISSLVAVLYGGPSSLGESH